MASLGNQRQRDVINGAIFMWKVSRLIVTKQAPVWEL
jgi:hypothetical protein